jgi:hypothetical protein
LFFIGLCHVCLVVGMQRHPGYSYVFQPFNRFSTKDRSLGHTVYRKVSHTNPDLSTRSHHHPTNKCAQYCPSWNTRPQPSMTRILTQVDLDACQSTLRNNRYSLREIHTADHTTLRLPHYNSLSALHPEHLTISADCYQNITSRWLIWYPAKSLGLLRPMKNNLVLKFPNIYSIPCRCREV